MENSLVKVGISVGDINGIGMEVIIKALSDARILQTCSPVVFGSPKLASYYRKQLNIQDFSFNFIKGWDSINHKQPSLYVAWEEEINIEPGADNALGGAYALRSLDAGIQALIEGNIDVLVTAPVNKHNIKQETGTFRGHTEYLGEKFGQSNPVMMMVSDSMRIVPVTGHIALSEVSGKISVDQITEKTILAIHSLQQDFSIRKPRVAVLGLNPHAGDDGLLGKEEQTIIRPSIDRLKEQGHLVFGPFPSDGFFGSGAFSKYDLIVAMYHDQALIPFKTLSFSNGVNFTAGLPYVRTSPDHGVAYDIAGQNKAREESFRKAVYLAVDAFKNRKQHREITSNPLKITQQKRER